MNVLNLLSQGHNLTETERALADYVVKHADDVTSLTIAQLGQLTHCSNSAIVRLCHKLGLEGYRELRIELARELERNRANLIDVNPDKPFIEESSTEEIASSIAALSKQAIDATYASVSMGSIRRAARLLRDARYVTYYAIGDSRASVEMFATLLYKVGIACSNGFPKGDISVFGHFLDARDVAIIVSYSGSLLRSSSSVINTLRARGCKTIIVTSDHTATNNLLGTDCVILLPAGEAYTQRIATFYSQACVRFALNCIYAEVFSANYQENYQRWLEARRLDEAST